uniref:Uncharacterized protein n=1 Tax=Arundo donax TaxID=35708 RepID=A0A0A8YCT8_ARUDO
MIDNNNSVLQIQKKNAGPRFKMTQ